MENPMYYLKTVMSCLYEVTNELKILWDMLTITPKGQLLRLAPKLNRVGCNDFAHNMIAIPNSLFAWEGVK